MIIQRVTDIADNDLTFVASKVNKNIGDQLHIFLTNPLNKGKSVDVVVYFETTKDQTGVSWIAKENTKDKQHKFMFTQC